MTKALLGYFWIACGFFALTAAQAQTPVISSTLSVSLTGDANSNSQANAGDQLSYSLVITNSGSGSATGVNLSMPAPANTTLVTGSLKTSTLARADSYTTLISGTLSATTVLGNDFGLPTKTVVSFGPSATPASVVADGSHSAPTDQNGTVVMNTDGTFSYTPTGSFVGYDTFSYTATTTTPPTDAAMVTIRVGTPVSAVANAYTITGNLTNTQSNTATALLGNDLGDQRVVTSVRGSSGTALAGAALTTAQSGTVTVQSDGTFVYEPPAGYTGVDSFTYTANNGLNLPSSAVVSLTIQDMIWFVNNTAPAGGTGSLARPFNTLAAFNSLNNGTGNNPAAGDNIFLYAGNYSGGLTLLANQKLFGQGMSAALSAATGITPAPGSSSLPTTSGADPVITNAGGNGISLASTNTLRGLTIGSSLATALSGSNFGTLTVSEVSLNTAGAALGLATGTVTGSFEGITSTGGTNNVSLTAVGGSLTIPAGSLSGATGPAFTVSGGTVGITYSGGISQTNNAALVSVGGGHASGTLLFQTGTLNATNGTGLQFNNADGTYTFTGTTTLNGGDAGIDIGNSSGGIFSFATSTTITNPSGSAYREDSSTPTVSYNGTISKTNNGVSAVVIIGKSGGTTSFGGRLTASTTTANALDLTGNVGGTVNFGGGNLVITTSSGIGFNATGGGTVSVTGTGNTISSPSATALNVVNTTIGASGLVFQSISSGNNSAAADPVNSIVLNNTGSSGGLTITGTNTIDGSGGTIQNITQRGVQLINTSNVTLKNITFLNANLQDAPAQINDMGSDSENPSFPSASAANGVIYLSSVSTVRLDNIDISGTTAQMGITGVNVSNFTLTASTITNTGDGAFVSGGGLFEDAIRMANLSGTCFITNSTLTFSETNTVDIFNRDVNLTLTIDGCNFNDTQTSSSGGPANSNGEGGFQFRVFSSAAGIPVNTIKIKNSSFLRLRTQGIQALASNDAKLSIDITNCTIDSQTDIGAGIDINGNENSEVNFNIIGNPLIQSRGGAAVNITSFVNAVVMGRVNDNPNITVNSIGAGVRALPQESSSHVTIEIKNNTITMASNNSSPIDVQARFGSARLDVTIDNNNLNSDPTAVSDMNIVAGSSTVGEANPRVFANIKNNDVLAGGPTNILRLRVSDLDGTTNPQLFLQGFLEGGAGIDDDAVATWNANGNTPTATPANVNVSLTGTATAPSAGTALLPTNPLP